MSAHIYLDYAASTPVESLVADAMTKVLKSETEFANPSSRHYYGKLAEDLVENARDQVASLIGADQRDVIWTSGTTEANNIVISSIGKYFPKGRIITSAIEHASVLGPLAVLEQQGFEVIYIQPEKSGRVDAQKIFDEITDDTIFVSLMHANNETGVIQPIEKVGQYLREKNILFHVDAAQSAGKIEINLEQLPVDYMSFSAHKIYGPKGAGALYIDSAASKFLSPLFYGGGHEGRLRSGTLATHQIVGIGKAFVIAKEKLRQDTKYLTHLSEALIDGLLRLDGVTINGDRNHALPGIINVSFADVDGENLMTSLNQLAVSFGSACSAKNQKPSHVLKAMSISRDAILSSMRISLGRKTTQDEIDQTLALIKAEVAKLRKRGSFWKL